MYDPNRRKRGRLLYGLGRLHPQNISGMTDRDHLPCMQQPGHRYPLWILHKELEEFVDAAVVFIFMAIPGDLHLQAQELKQQSLRAADAQNKDAFYRVVEEAVECVTGAGRHYLESHSGANVDPDVDMDLFIELCNAMQKSGAQLLSAREGKWRAAYD